MSRKRFGLGRSAAKNLPGSMWAPRLVRAFIGLALLNSHSDEMTTRGLAASPTKIIQEPKRDPC